MATITVTNLNDSGAGSLRDAISTAAPGDTINFDPGLVGGTLFLTNGELDITRDVTIDGDINRNGTPAITIDAGGNSRVFQFEDSITATLNGLVLQNGQATGADGGGIAIGQFDRLTLSNSRLADNSASNGGAVFVGALSSLTLLNSAIANNHADIAGGGIYDSLGSVTIVNSTLSGNSATQGGGINDGGTLTLVNATLSGNSADQGGGIDLNGTAKLYDSTLTGNLATGQDGGIEADLSNLTLSNSIVAGNNSPSNDDVAGSGTNIYFHGNDILGSPVVAFGGSIQGPYTQIDGTSQAALESVFARVAQNPNTNVLSGALANNGGPVRTVAINPAGVAYNAGVNAALPPDTFDLNNNSITAEPLPVDARGFTRVVGGTVDIGAFEQQQGNIFVVTTLADETYDGGTLAQETADGTGLSLREALGLANQDPTSHDTIVFDPNLIGGSTHGVNDGTLLLTNGQLTVNGNVTIEGDINGDNAPDITIDGQGISRDLDITGGNVTIDGLTITGGYASLHGGGVSLGYGGNGPANVSISHSVIANNQSVFGGGISVDQGDALSLSNSVVSGNYAYLVGGGIANQGALQMRDTAVLGNKSGYIGGGVANSYYGTLTVVNSTIANNQITHSVAGPLYDSAGGGLYNAGSAALVNTTIANNTGAYAGGGIYNSEVLQLTNVTVANNSAYKGGGLYNAPCGCGNITIYNSTFTGNYVKEFGGGVYIANGAVTLTNSIVAGNGTGHASADFYVNPLATTNYAGVNLFSQPAIGRPGIDIYQPDLTQVFASLTTFDPDGVPTDVFQAGTLANNGGPVQTVGIKVGGSAQDTGSIADLPPDSFDLNNNFNTAESLPVDARGDPRVFGAGLDIGAFEAQAPVLNNVPASANYIEQAPPVELSPAFGNPNALTVSDAGSTILTGAVVTISTGSVEGDVLAADTTGTGISASYDPTSKTLTLTGDDTLTNYSQVLDSVTFSSTSDNPDNFGANPTRTVTWSATDAGGGTSAPGTTTIGVIPVNDPPSLSNVATADIVAFPGQIITVSPLVSVSDPDNLNLAGATVQITGGTFAGDGDNLAATTTGTGISANFNPLNETLSLSGNDTLAHYAQVLDSVTFNSTSADPTNGGTNKTRTVTWTANDGSGVNNLSAPATTTIGFQQSVPFDLNGDAVSDLAFQNNGTPQIWLWNGTSVTSQATFANPGASWHIIASRDVNGDGTADLIWQNNNGQPGVWLMNGTTPLAEAGLANPGTAWKLIGSGDFNGDGRADLLWQDVAGNVGIWEMNGTTPIAEAGIGNPGPNWKVVGAADFNADGRDDILLQNTATGNLMIDLMNGTSITSTVSIAVGDASWHAVSVGEFNGQAEIAWQNSNGTPGLWLMNGTTPAAAVGLPNPGA
ncbi:MAG TPA: FG-GAP-like repeat-containing protein, partial [Xanthobacteraceae bacterium]|nr:FG-GAP-like repeat-containing protein [Xanthobacteraceae bacterium]